MKGSCGNCKAFSRLVNECHLKSPKVFILPSREGALQTLGVFPPTKPENWCLKWEQDPDVNDPR